jgi:hypothetical protein
VIGVVAGDVSNATTKAAPSIDAASFPAHLSNTFNTIHIKLGND